MITPNGLYVSDDISFHNINQVLEVSNHFKKFGCYTKLHPKKDKREFEEFWDNEEYKLDNGVHISGGLVNGIIQDVHITGEHYGFLNYGRMKKTTTEDLKNLQHVKKDKIKNERSVGNKAVDFPDFWDGHYHWFKAKDFAASKGLNLVGLKARRKGFSYVGGYLAAHRYNRIPNSSTLVGAFDTKYLFKGDGIMRMAKNYLDWFNTQTEWKKKRLINLKDHVKAGYKIQGEDEDYGYKSQIIAVTFMNNPDAAIGKDADLILLDELGKFNNIKEALAVTQSTIEDGDIITGQIIMWGTGGTDEANWEEFEHIYYNPSSYKCLAFDNIWDEGLSGTNSGFFFSHLQNLKPYYDENGNTDFVKAKEAADYERQTTKETKTQVDDYNKYIGQRCYSPSEAFARSSDNIFTSSDLIEHLSNVLHNPDIIGLPRIGKLKNTDEGIRFEMSDEHPVVPYKFEAKDDLTGCVVEWIPPYKDKETRQVPNKLYRAWHDPYATDKDKKDITVKNSLGATYIYERANNLTETRGDVLVAMYVGRPEKMELYNEELFKLLLYYNAELMFENDRGDVRNFFRQKRMYHLLADEPNFKFNPDLSSSKNTKDKGISMNNPQRKSNAALYLRDWLYSIRSVSEDGIIKYNFHYIYDAGLLQELLKWNLNGNFDRVSAILVGMFDIKEQFDIAVEESKPIDINDFFNRKFFQ